MFITKPSNLNGNKTFCLTFNNKLLLKKYLGYAKTLSNFPSGIFIKLGIDNTVWFSFGLGCMVDGTLTFNTQFSFLVEIIILLNNGIGGLSTRNLISH